MTDDQHPIGYIVQEISTGKILPKSERGMMNSQEMVYLQEGVSPRMYDTPVATNKAISTWRGHDPKNRLKKNYQIRPILGMTFGDPIKHTTKEDY